MFWLANLAPERTLCENLVVVHVLRYDCNDDADKADEALRLRTLIWLETPQQCICKATL